MPRTEHVVFVQFSSVSSPLLKHGQQYSAKFRRGETTVHFGPVTAQFGTVRCPATWRASATVHFKVGGTAPNGLQPKLVSLELVSASGGNRVGTLEVDVARVLAPGQDSGETRGYEHTFRMAGLGASCVLDLLVHPVGQGHPPSLNGTITSNGSNGSRNLAGSSSASSLAVPPPVGRTASAPQLRANTMTSARATYVAPPSSFAHSTEEPKRRTARQTDDGGRQRRIRAAAGDDEQDDGDQDARLRRQYVAELEQSLARSKRISAMLERASAAAEMYLEGTILSTSSDRGPRASAIAALNDPAYERVSDTSKLSGEAEASARQELAVLEQKRNKAQTVVQQADAMLDGLSGPRNELARLQRQLADLERDQARRDVSNDVIDVLSRIDDAKSRESAAEGRMRTSFPGVAESAVRQCRDEAQTELLALDQSMAACRGRLGLVPPDATAAASKRAAKEREAMEVAKRRMVWALVTGASPALRPSEGTNGKQHGSKLATHVDPTTSTSAVPKQTVSLDALFGGTNDPPPARPAPIASNQPRPVSAGPSNLFAPPRAPGAAAAGPPPDLFAAPSQAAPSSGAPPTNANRDAPDLFADPPPSRHGEVASKPAGLFEAGGAREPLTQPLPSRDLAPKPQPVPDLFAGPCSSNQPPATSKPSASSSATTPQAKGLDLFATSSDGSAPAAALNLFTTRGEDDEQGGTAADRPPSPTLRKEDRAPAASGSVDLFAPPRDGGVFGVSEPAAKHTMGSDDATPRGGTLFDVPEGHPGSVVAVGPRLTTTEAILPPTVMPPAGSAGAPSAEAVRPSTRDLFAPATLPSMSNPPTTDLFAPAASPPPPALEGSSQPAPADSFSSRQGSTGADLFMAPLAVGGTRRGSLFGDTQRTTTSEMSAPPSASRTGIFAVLPAGEEDPFATVGSAPTRVSAKGPPLRVQRVPPSRPSSGLAAHSSTSSTARAVSFVVADDLFAAEAGFPSSPPAAVSSPPRGVGLASPSSAVVDRNSNLSAFTTTSSEMAFNAPLQLNVVDHSVPPSQQPPPAAFDPFGGTAKQHWDDPENDDDLFN